MEDAETCQLCNKSFKAITTSHLKKHNYTGIQYAGEFGPTKFFSNLVGQRIGNFTITRYIKVNAQRNVVWEATCRCGSIVQNTRDKFKRRNSCGCNRSLDPMVSSFAVLVDDYARSAERRSLSFELNCIEAYFLFTNRCFYCGTPPKSIKNRYRSNNGNITTSVKNPDEAWHQRADQADFYYNGIDRIDNAKSYVLDNCVSCCAICNFAKRTSSFDDYTYHIAKQAAHYYDFKNSPRRRNAKKDWGEKLTRFRSQIKEQIEADVRLKFNKKGNLDYFSLGDLVIRPYQIPKKFQYLFELKQLANQISQTTQEIKILEAASPSNNANDHSN